MINASQPIPDDPKIPAAMAIIYNGPGQINHTSDPANHYNGQVGIEMRGSTSQSLSPKKPYGFELRDNNGKSVNLSLLGMPAESDWVLLAPYFDKSLIRDPLIQLLAGQFMEYAPRMRFCELVLNDEYRGVYILGEKIKRNAARLNITKISKTDISGDAITGGYLYKLDKTTGEEVVSGWNSKYDGNKTYFQFETPKPVDISPEQKTYAQGVINHFEDVLQSDDFVKPATGYSTLIDMGTFVDFMIVNELTRNVDGYRLSTFFYKDRDSTDSRIKMGPVWDFNIAFGNANYCNGSSTTGWALDFNKACPQDGYQIPFWWSRMMTDTTFRMAASERWLQLRQNVLSDVHIRTVLDSMVALLSEAQVRNFNKWPILSTWVWPNNYVGGTYQNEINYLKTWIADRTKWLDGAFDDLGKPLTVGICWDEEKSDPSPERPDPVVYPNPAGDQDPTFKYFVHEGDVVTIRIFNSTGAQVDKWVDSNCQNGWNQSVWNMESGAGIYFYIIYFNERLVQSGKIVRN